MFDLHKRISRKTYYTRLVVSYVVIFGLAIIVDILPEENVASLIGFLCFLVVALIWMAVLIIMMKQRANDVGKNTILLTAISFWTPFFLILGCIPGQKHSNKYGPVPR